MTQDLKDLLLQNLSARLSYGVKVNHTIQGDFTLIGLTNDRIFTDCEKKGYHNDFPLDENIKPYLFPLSSLTSKQRTEIGKILTDVKEQYSPYGVVNTEGCDNLFICSVKQSNALINYCLSQHLDINGLIEKSLALDATNLNIY